MLRFLVLFAFVAVAASAVTPKPAQKIYSISINFHNLQDLHNLNKIFKTQRDYQVKQVAVRDDIKALVLVRENLAPTVKNYLDSLNIKNTMKVETLFRFTRDADYDELEFENEHLF